MFRGCSTRVNKDHRIAGTYIRSLFTVEFRNSLVPRSRIMPNLYYHDWLELQCTISQQTVGGVRRERYRCKTRAADRRRSGSSQALPCRRSKSTRRYHLVKVSEKSQANLPNKKVVESCCRQEGEDVAVESESNVGRKRNLV